MKTAPPSIMSTRSPACIDKMSDAFSVALQRHAGRLQRLASDVEHPPGVAGECRTGFEQLPYGVGPQQQDFRVLDGKGPRVSGVRA